MAVSVIFALSNEKEPISAYADSDGETTMAQIVSWYDNEASYTHQFVNTLIYWCESFY